MDYLANRSDEAYVPAFKLGNVVPVLSFLAICHIVNEFLWDVRDGHPRELFAYRNCIYAAVGSNLVPNSTRLFPLYTSIALASYQFKESLVLQTFLVLNHQCHHMLLLTVWALHDRFHVPEGSAVLSNLVNF